jgi:hypothetical protein
MEIKEHLSKEEILLTIASFKKGLAKCIIFTKKMKRGIG